MTQYTAQSLEVLSGLDPVRRRPGMYTDTSRPNHLAQEVIDNAVDEALAGHASQICVTVYEDGSLSVEDNGSGVSKDIRKKLGRKRISNSNEGGHGFYYTIQRLNKIYSNKFEHKIITAPEKGTIIKFLIPKEEFNHD